MEVTPSENGVTEGASVTSETWRRWPLRRWPLGRWPLGRWGRYAPGRQALERDAASELRQRGSMPVGTSSAVIA